MIMYELEVAKDCMVPWDQFLSVIFLGLYVVVTIHLFRGR